MAVVPVLISCGTGIDSTARITYNDVKRQVGALTPEEQLVADILPEPLSDWTPGKRFYVVDDRLKVLLGATAPDYPIAGEYLSFIEARENISPLGGKVTKLSFLTQRGDEVVYPLNLSLGEVSNRRRVDIPFTIEESLIDATRAKLAGRQLYVLVADRYHPDGSNSRRPKFIPVTVKAVNPGNDIYPVSVVMDEGDSGSSMVYMNVGSEAGSKRTFNTLFSLDNPRSRYGDIKDDTWQLIVNNKVTEGMTRSECRLAAGPPVDIKTTNTGGYILEIWMYDSGVTLRFEDGILKQFKL